MKDKETLHRRTQELIDCFATTDPLKEMSELGKREDEEEAALKWLALAALHGINMNAKKISILKSGDGEVKVIAEYRDSELPSPGSGIGQRIIDVIRGITYLEEDKASTILALGIREGSIDLKVKVEKKGDAEKVTLKFPE
jgi:hypothetical protein